MRINSDKFDAVNAALDLVQTRARVRKLTALDIARILARVNCKLDIPKKALKGTCVKYTGAEHFPSAYNGIPESTHFTAEYSGRTWFITSITRDKCPNARTDTHITLSESAKIAVLDGASRL